MKLVVNDAEVHVWIINARAAMGCAPTRTSCLSADELARASRFRRPRDAASFAARRAVLRDLLGSYLGRPPATIELEHTCVSCGAGHGRPRLRGPAAPLHFSVSRTDDHFVYAFSCRAPVGVDIESVRSCAEWDAVAPLALSAREPQHANDEQVAAASTALVARAWSGQRLYLHRRGAPAAQRFPRERIPHGPPLLLGEGRCFTRAALCTIFPMGLLWVLVSAENRSLQVILLRTSVVYD